jgi:gliding motility-associated-like protein
MKKLLAFLAITLSFGLSAQNFLTSFGGLNNDEALAIGSDNAGKLYTTGYFNNSINYQGVQFSSNGFSDVFVVRSAATGHAEWAFSGGSTGPDRGYAIAVQPNGTTAVTGYHSNNATFGSEILTSNAASQDLFVLKLDPTGQVEWVRNFGGELGDTGYGIDFDNQGNVLVTGQFRGTINFDGIFFTSTPQAIGGGLSYDTFILKLDASGNVLWAKHGQNSYEGRGLDIKADNEGNVIVCGQFSDTLTFDVTHPNDIYNAAFVVKFDSNGNEIWFRHFTSSQTIAYAIETNSQNEIYVTGDNIGPMVFFTDENPEYFTVNYTYNLFLAKFDGSGDLLWLTNNGSGSEVSSKAIVLDADENPYITGTFRCSFEEYSLEYGTGIFYSAGYRDVFISKFNPAGERQYSRHMASNHDSFCSAIAIKNEDLPVIAGGFENKLVINSAPGFINHTGNSTEFSYSSMCEDQSSSVFRMVTSAGNKDIFLTSPINLQLEPMDPFNRADLSCDRPYLPFCVNLCADTLIHCGPEIANATSHWFWHLNPLNNYSWSSVISGDLIASNSVPVTDTYFWSYERLDGCQSFADTLHAIIHPVPLPLVSDDEGINILSPPHSDLIELCYPDSVLLMGTNFSENDSIWWASNNSDNIIPTDSDSAIYVNLTGSYFFTIQNEFGCSRHNNVPVKVYYPIDSIGAFISFPGYPEPVDTITICYGDDFEALLNQGDSALMTIQDVINNSEVDWEVSPEPSSISSGSDAIDANVLIYASGYYTITVEIDGVCDSTNILIERSVYVVVNPEPVINVWLNGNNNICPGDTTLIIATGGITYNWNGPEFLQLSNDSALVWQPGTYSASSSITNEFGCSDVDWDYFYLSYYPTPVITMFPASGIVCPFDSVLLMAPNALAYTWVGPNGQIIGATQNIYVSIPGYYHCIVTNFNGCPRESNFLEVKEYASPYLIATPGNDICFTGSVDIDVITDPSATFQWGPPLSGFGQSVTVSEPGTYTCSATLCGITTNLSIDIYETSVNSFVVLNAPPTVCDSGSVLLQGNPGMYAYEWQPGGETTQNLLVTEPGIYTLFTYDEQGCSGASQPIEITGAPAVPLNQIQSPYICQPDSVWLGVTGNFVSYSWFPNGETTSGIWITEPGAYLVYATDANGCVGKSFPQEFFPGAAPDTPNAEDVIHCSGDDLMITIPTTNALYWETSDGPILSNPIIIESLTADTVLYYYVANEFGCISITDSINVTTISNTYNPIILGDTIYCLGDLVSLSTIEIANSSYQWTVNNSANSQTNTLLFTAEETLGTSVEITLNVVVQNCATGFEDITIHILPLPEPLPILGEFDICQGDTALLYTTLTDSITANWSWYNFESTADSIYIQTLPGDSILVQLVAEMNGCYNLPTNQWMYLHPYPTIDSVLDISPICAGEILGLSAVSSENASMTITTPDGLVYPSGQLAIYDADTTHTGYYNISAQTEYCISYQPVWLEVFPLPDIELGNDSLYCTGSMANFSIDDYDLVIWNQTVSSSSFQTSITEMITVQVINDFGCLAKDSVFVQFEDCDGPLNNVMTPNGDGINDVYYFNLYGFNKTRVLIYNRWGKLLCELIDLDYWDGTNCKNGEFVSDGVYYYILDYTSRESVNGVKKGYIHVFR